MSAEPVSSDFTPFTNVSILGPDQARVLLSEPRMLTLYEYWHSKLGQSRAPARVDLDPPLDIPKLLPHLFMIRLQPGAKGQQLHDFRLTLVGTHLVHITGRDNTGKIIDQAQQRIVLDRFMPVLKDMQKSPCPHFGKGPATWINKDYLEFQRLMLPLCDDLGRLSHVLGCMTFSPLA